MDGLSEYERTGLACFVCGNLKPLLEFIEGNVLDILLLGDVS